MDIELFAKNENKWVATDKIYKTIIASSETLSELQRKIKKLKIKNAVIMFVPSFNKTLAP